MTSIALPGALARQVGGLLCQSQERHNRKWDPNILDTKLPAYHSRPQGPLAAKSRSSKFLGPLKCRSYTPGTTVSPSEPKGEALWKQNGENSTVAGNVLESSNAATNDQLPSELSSTLADLVSQLSSSSSPENDARVTEIKAAFGALAQDIKRQLATVKLSQEASAAVFETSPKQASVAATGLRPQRPTEGNTSVAAGAPGRRRLSPPTDAEAFRASAGLSDLEGLIPQPKTAQSTQEPSVPRSELTAVRSRLNKKLSESNTYNRFLLREIQYREDAIRDTKAVLVALLSELKEVSSGLGELASLESFLPSAAISQGCRPSVLHSKIQGLLQDLEKQLGGVDAMKLREIPLLWYGMAEDVKVMGSFDGWTYGEQMSPETTGTMTRFATVLKLRPGRYEIKFLVDGEWRVAPEWPTVGHGMTENNVLVVD